MNTGPFRRRRIGAQPEIGGQALQLGVQVLPLADPQVVEELRAAHAAEGGAGQLALAIGEVVPEREEGEEVRFRLGEAAVRGVGGLLVVGGAFPGVLDGQRGRDDQDLAGAALAVRFDDHAGDAGVDGEAGHLPARVGEPVALHGVELLEQPYAVGDAARVRRVDEGERADVAETGGGHLEDDRREVRALDLGVGVLGARVEVLFRVQPDADAVGDAAAAALALVGAGLGDGLDGQALDLGAQRVAGDAGGAGIDDVADAGDGERGFRDVRGEHDAAVAHGPAGGELEDAVLFGGGQAAVEREDVEVLAALEGVGGVADLALAGEEHENVAGAAGTELVDGVADRLDLVAVLRVSLLWVGDRAVADLDGVGAAGDLDDRRGLVVDGEVGGEAFRVDRRRGDDHLEVGAARQELPEVAEDEVDVQAALVGLVDDQRVVPGQVAVAGDLVEEDAVGHDLDEGVVAGLVGEPDLVADGGAELGAGFLGDTLGDSAGGDPSWLGVADLAGDAAAELKADLGQLGGLARPGLAGHDDDLVVPDGLGDVVLALADRQLCRVADVRDRFAAPGYPAGRPLDLGGQLGDGLVAGGLVPQAAGPVDTPGQPVLVVQHQLGQGAAQVSERGQRGRLIHQRKRVEEEDPVVPTLLGLPGFPVTGWLPHLLLSRAVRGYGRRPGSHWPSRSGRGSPR